jgi:hypothetical protein
MLTLEGFRKRAGLNPWHFWQLADATVAPVNSACNTVVSEYAWQSGSRASRSELRRAIIRAGEKLKQAMGFAAVREQVFERIPFPAPHATRQQYARSQDAKGRWIATRTRYGYVRRVGEVKATEIAVAALTFTDENNDGVDDHANVSATFLYPASEAALYLPSSQWQDGAMGEAWRVEPRWMRVSASTLTASVPLWMLVKRDLYEGNTNKPVPITPASFVDSLVVARRYIDTTAQGYFVWESLGEACSEGDDPSSLTRQVARFTVRNERLGWIAGETAEYDSVGLHWHASGWALGRQPDFIEVNYEAGLDDSEAVNEAHYLLTCAELADGLCQCNAANEEVTKWQDDRAEGTADRNVNASADDLGNPLGTRLGQIEAWKLIKNLRRVDASVVVR